MANDNKIKIGKAEVKLFLSNEILPSENDNPTIYDLEAEYAKTRKGKSHFTIWVLLGCTAVVALLTFCVTKYIEYRNNNISVGIHVFEDLNLKNLLDVVSRTEATMQEVTNKKIQLEAEKKSYVSQAEIKKEGDLATLDSLRLSSSERRKREQAINQEFEQEMKTISEKYDSQIDICSIQIEELQGQLSSYDKKNVEIAQQQEAAINSQRQIFELEKAEMEATHNEKIADLQNQMATMQQQMLDSRKASLDALTVQYEAEIAKLDPVLDYPIATEIISKTTDLSENDNAPSPRFNDSQFQVNLSDEITVSQVQGFLGNLNQQFEDYNYIANIVKGIQWRNTLGDYTSTLTSLANNMGIDAVNEILEILQSQEVRFQQEKESYAYEMSSNLRHSNNEYEKIYSAFETMATRNNHMGYILDTSDTSNMLVYVIDSLKNKVQEGTRVSVVDFQGNIIGQGNLLPKGEFIYLVPDYQEQGALFQPTYEIQIDATTLKQEEAITSEPVSESDVVVEEVISDVDENTIQDDSTQEESELTTEAIPEETTEETPVSEEETVEGEVLEEASIDVETVMEQDLVPEQEDSITTELETEMPKEQTEEKQVPKEGFLQFNTK